MRTAVLAAVAAAAVWGCQPDRPPGITHEIPFVGAAGSAEPNLSAAADGTTILSWLEPDGDGVALRYSVLDEMRWSGPATIAASDSWFVNWADFPSVVKVDHTLWAAHWLAKKPGGTYAYDVAISLSHDGGKTWDEPITPHTDDTATEHGFVSLFPWQGGVGALWLDGRNTSPDGSHDHGASSANGMTLRSAVIGPNGELRNEQLADDLVCDCCQTDVTIGPDGPIAVYRNRTAGEIRDIYVMRSSRGAWIDATPIADDGWEIAGCPVNGPAITSDGRQVAIAWFTAADEKPRVRFARSEDAGITFGDAIDVAEDGPAGRVDVAILENGVALVSWLRTRDGGQGEIVVRRVNRDGDMGPEYVLATTGAGRMSGFPQMVRYGGGVVLAWTDTLGEGTRVRTSTFTPSSFALRNYSKSR